MTIGLEIVVILLLIVLNGLFSLSELALVSVRRARLAVLERKGVKGATAARALSDDPQRFLPTVQVGITLVSVLTGVFGGARIASHLQAWLATFPQIAEFAESLALAIVVIVTTYLTLVLGELVPKQLALRSPGTDGDPGGPPDRDAVAHRRSGGLAAGQILQRRPACCSACTGPSRQSVTEEELKALLLEGAQTGVLEMEERDMIERVLRLADKPVRAIMTPRTELAWIDRTHPAKAITAALKAAPHSRFVVCDRSIDNVVGVVQAKDLLDRILSGGELSVSASLRQPMIVPDAISALDALERLKSDSLGLALVMDEYGSFEGVVTAADVLQAIVGDGVRAGTPGRRAGPGRRDHA